MDNLTQENYTEPKVPDNPIRYLEEYNRSVGRLVMLMSPLLLLTVWVNIYLVLKIILYFSRIYYKCVEKKDSTVCSGEFKCKERCENCTGEIFLKTYT